MKRSCEWRSFHINENVESASSAIDLALTIVDYPSKDELVKAFAECLHDTVKLVDSLSSQEMINDWIDAAKRHKDEVVSINAKIIESSRINGCSNPVRSINRSRLEILDHDEIEEQKIRPRSFWRMYKLFWFVQDCETTEQLIAVLEVISTLFLIYKDLRILLDSPLAEEKAYEHINEQKSTDVVDKRPDHIDLLGSKYHINWMEELENFLTEIDEAVSKKSVEGLEGLERVYADCAIKFASKYIPRDMVNDLPLTSSSSGAVIKGVKSDYSLPGFLASAYEVRDTEDHSEFDSIVGYTPSPRITNTRLCSVKNKSVFLQHRSKVDLRCIFILHNEGQDRMSFFGHLLDQLNHVMRMFCKVYSQNEAVSNVERWFREGWRAIYSLDLHAATDRLDRRPQELLIRHVLKWTGKYSDEQVDCLAKTWGHYMSLPTSAIIPGTQKKETWSLATGQQMGFHSSIQSLNAFHIVDCILCIRVANRILKEHSEQTLFGMMNLIGDDNVSGFKQDKYMVFPTIYKDSMAQFNTECNLSKGYLFNKDVPQYSQPLAEIAKNLICNGTNITPFPPGAITQCGSIEGVITFLEWLVSRNERVYSLELHQLCEWLSKHFSLKEVMSFLLMVFSPLKNVASDLFPRSVCRSKDRKIESIFSIVMLRKMVVLSRLTSHRRDPSYVPKVTDRYSFDKEYRQLFDGIIYNRHQLKGNKVVSLIDSLETLSIAQAVALDDIGKGLLPSDESIYDYIGTVEKLSQESLNSILTINDILASTEIDDLDLLHQYFEDLDYDSLFEAISRIKLYDFKESYNRYNHSGDVITKGMDLESLFDDFSELAHHLLKDADKPFFDFFNYVTERFPRHVRSPWSSIKMDWDTFQTEEEITSEQDEFSLEMQNLFDFALIKNSLQ